MDDLVSALWFQSHALHKPLLVKGDGAVALTLTLCANLISSPSLANLAALPPPLLFTPARLAAKMLMRLVHSNYSAHADKLRYSPPATTPRVASDLNQ